MSAHAKGSLIIIGGHEDKQGEETILQEVVRQIRGDGQLLIVTVATQEPAKMARQYRSTFSDLGVKRIEVLDIRTRDHAYDEANVEKLQQSSVIFFTGGDQLRITSQIGDSPIFRNMSDLFQRGRTIVGTSAGAAAMPETMLLSGPSDESNKISTLAMAPGLGLIDGVVIDSHFAERGRMGRLLGAVAQNPRNLGLGIDENTAIMADDSHFKVIGSGAVYVVDGTRISYSSLSESNPEGVVSIDDVTLHVLGEGDRFDLKRRHRIRTAEERAGTS